jgi:transposase
MEAAMWTDEARALHKQQGGRYPSDTTDTQWALLAPMIPPPRTGGRPRETDMRRVVDAILYVLRTGCQWRQLPKDFPARSTVYDYFWEWQRYGTLDRMLHALLMECREADGREATPSAAVIDSQSVKSAEKGGPRSIPRDTTRARRSRGASVTRSSTPAAIS